jgi:hypothetical protein
MNPSSHLAKANEIRQSLDRLLPDPSGANVAAITELAFGIAHHLIAAGTAAKFGQHLDTHEGVTRLLRRNKAAEIAEAFERLDQLRVEDGTAAREMERLRRELSRTVVEECLALLKQIEDWST